MAETSNFELFYDVLEESISKLYEIKHDRFFKLLVDTGKNIVANDVLCPEATIEQKNEIMQIYEKLSDVSFNVEEGTIIDLETTSIPDGEKEGYIFKGWDFDFSNRIMNDTEIKGIWEPIS